MTVEPDPTTETVAQFADQLRQYATHFAPRDWDYTREHRIKRIVYVTKRGDYDHWWRRVKRAIHELVRRRNDSLDRMIPVPRHMAWTYLRGDANRPDGWLDNGGIITQWEENGEYLQYVQPTVGEMLADWLDAEPDSPHALRIAGEMRRINARYSERIAAAPVDGSPDHGGNDG